MSRKFRVGIPAAECELISSLVSVFDLKFPGCHLPAWSSHCSPGEYCSSCGLFLDWQLVPQDISHENVLVNLWGVRPPSIALGRKPPEVRNSFPAKYAIINFRLSVRLLPESHLSSPVGVWLVPREQSAPETQIARRKDSNSFAADVYQMGWTIYGWCRVSDFIMPTTQKPLTAVGEDIHRSYAWSAGTSIRYDSPPLLFGLVLQRRVVGC
jgi:hypothetical protein